MRTTIDLPEDLHKLARELAHQQDKSLSEVVAALIRQGLEPVSPPEHTSIRGLPLVSLGRTITAEDVRSLDDEA